VLGIGGTAGAGGDGPEAHRVPHERSHSAFLALEQVRVLMRDRKLTFEEALEAARASNVFTITRRFPPESICSTQGLNVPLLLAVLRRGGRRLPAVMALGRRNVFDRDERFSMAVLALNTSAYRNAVSACPAGVAGDVPRPLAAAAAVEVPITSITNGVHLPSWLNTTWRRCTTSTCNPTARPFQRRQHLEQVVRSPTKNCSKRIAAQARL